RLTSWHCWMEAGIFPGVRLPVSHALRSITEALSVTRTRWCELLAPSQNRIGLQFMVPRLTVEISGVVVQHSMRHLPMNWLACWNGSLCATLLRDTLLYSTVHPTGLLKF